MTTIQVNTPTYGSCGVEDCTDCLPLFDKDNQELACCTSEIGPVCQHRIRKWTPDEAGCLINGHQGWHGHAYMVDLAVQSGYPIDEADAEYLELYRRDETCADCIDNISDLMDKAERWMNENVAPDGYSFGWHEGEFFLGHEKWWGQDDAAGYDRDEDGDPVAIDIHGEPL